MSLFVVAFLAISSMVSLFCSSTTSHFDYKEALASFYRLSPLDIFPPFRTSFHFLLTKLLSRYLKPENVSSYHTAIIPHQRHLDSMVLPFPYRLITSWINEPGPSPFDGPNLEFVQAPWTCMKKPDCGSILSKECLGLGSNMSLKARVEIWKLSGFSPRVLHCGSIERLLYDMTEWLEARLAHEETLTDLELLLGCMEADLKLELEYGPGDLTEMAESVEEDIATLHDLHTKVGGILEEEVRGTFLVLSFAARWGSRLLSRPEERLSIMKQLLHLLGGQLTVETEEQISGVRLVDRFNTLVSNHEDFRQRVQWVREGNQDDDHPRAASVADAMDED